MTIEHPGKRYNNYMNPDESQIVAVKAPKYYCKLSDISENTGCPAPNEVKVCFGGHPTQNDAGEVQQSGITECPYATLPPAMSNTRRVVEEWIKEGYDVFCITQTDGRFMWSHEDEAYSGQITSDTVSQCGHSDKKNNPACSAKNLQENVRAKIDDKSFPVKIQIDSVSNSNGVENLSIG